VRDEPARPAGAVLPAAGPPAQRAALKFFHGPMDCGKSTLALQIDYNHARQGRRGLLLTRHDRAGQARISTRIGLGRPAVEVTDATDLRELAHRRPRGERRLDYLICDEAQFYTVEQVEQMADLVDGAGVDVYAFGLATDFRSRLFPAAQRLLELADEVLRLQVEVLCWCGTPGLLNARVVGGSVVRAGAQVLIADVETGAEAAAAGVGEPGEVHYQVLCRRHHRSGELGPPAKPAPTGG
jgi:thymidine kinase